MTTLSKLLEDLRNRETFPVYLDEVDSWVKSNKRIHEIGYYPSGYPKGSLQGSYHKYEQVQGVYNYDALEIVEITYSKDLNDCHRRFVCVKELMHVFDLPDSYTKTDEEIEKLTFNLLYQNDSTEPPPKDIVAEKAAMGAALCVLAPLDIVLKMKPKVLSGSLTIETMAEFLRIPKKYVGYLLSDRYPILYNRLANLTAAGRAA